MANLLLPGFVGVFSVINPYHLVISQELYEKWMNTSAVPSSLNRNSYTCCFNIFTRQKLVIG